MKKPKTSRVMLFFPILIPGCANQQTPPLFFGEQVTFGIDIGAGPSSEGVDFTLGYKDLDIAIVPVSVVNNGMAQEVVAWNQEEGGNRRDALSVFGQFKGQGGQSENRDAGKAARSISLGRFFATGLAATSLAEGYKDGWSDSPQTTKKVSEAIAPQSVSPSGAPASTSKETATKPSQEVGKTNQSPVDPEPQSQAYAPPLVFAQTNTLGMGIATTAADQGAHFTLGYTGRDIAFIPVMARSGNGSLQRLGGRNQVGPNGKLVDNPKQSVETDALSVFGQFKADTETRSVQFGLSRFFTTGMAARNLAEGFKAAISSELKAERQKTPVSGQ